MFWYYVKHLAFFIPHGVYEVTHKRAFVAMPSLTNAQLIEIRHFMGLASYFTKL